MRNILITKSSFSNYNDINDPDPYVDISSPGGFSFNGLVSTVASEGDDAYGFKSGTSMACPCPIISKHI